MPFAPDRYEQMRYRRCGRSGLQLPAISLGGWQAIGSYVDHQRAQELFFTAFDHGITHFDFANNYGKPPGESERVFGRILRDMPRDELIISSKAGYDMWPGPYGDWGSRKYIIASCDASLQRLGVDYVDIFYHHRYDPHTPLDETLMALEHLVERGKALYVGISNYPDPHLTRAVSVMQKHARHPLTIHQPCYNLLRREAETQVFPTAHAAGMGVIAYCPLAQGQLTERYLDGIPADSRAAQRGGWLREQMTPQRQALLRRLAAIAGDRGQSLAQMALSWVLRDERVTSALIGASKAEQIVANVTAIDAPAFTTEELKAIDAICDAWTKPVRPPG